MRFAALLVLALAVTGCATMSDDPTAGLDNPAVTTRTEANGDVIEEYRVAGRLQVVKVTPRNAPTYFIVDSDGDGRPDSSKGEGPVSPVYWTLFKW